MTNENEYDGFDCFYISPQVLYHMSTTTALMSEVSQIMLQQNLTVTSVQAPVSSYAPRLDSVLAIHILHQQICVLH